MFKSNVPNLIGKRIVETGEIPSNTDIVEATGLTRQTVINWLNKDKRFKSIDADVIRAWLNYFQMEEERAGELFTIVPNPDK